ncbi:integrase, catalytic region, zinc finger, CCHC-type containing protein [Tanacetum coccineum]
MTPENKEHFQSEKEAIFLLLTGIGDEIYSTVDACNTANEMWIAIERLQQGESLNVQDVKTNLFWEFGKFTSRDGESMESYYSRFYKLMNELTRNNLQVTTMQVNVQFLQQLQPEWSRNKTEDTTPRYNNDNQSRQFGNQRTMTVAGARETVGSQVVQQTGIQCFNCKGYGHYAKECRKPKRVKDYAYHKEKMMMCKQAEQGVPLQADWLLWFRIESLDRIALILRHGDMIIIFGAVVKSSLELSTLWLSCSWICDALAVSESSSGSSTVVQWVRLHPQILYQLPTRVFIPVSSSDIESEVVVVVSLLRGQLNSAGWSKHQGQ